MSVAFQSDLPLVYQPNFSLSKELVSSQAEKIQEVAKRSGVLGIGVVQDRESDRTELVYVQKVKAMNELYFYVRSIESDDVHGKARVRIFDEKSHSKDPDLFNDYGGMGVNKIYLEGLRNSSCKAKGVGFLLVKAALQENQTARMNVDAISNVGFFYKLGFRSKIQEVNEELEKALAEKKEPRRLQLLPMFLPQAAQEKWMQRIKDDPIQFPLKSPL
jgi:hypothetical protein